MIATAGEVNVTVIGTRGAVDRYFSEENFKNLRVFLAKYGT